MLASAAEAHDHTTGRHLQRVRQISEALARELGYDDERAAALGMAATLHDIGKIRVPDSVLGSSNSLAEAEWVLMKQHTLWGSAFLGEQPGFELAASVARHHHERWDGGGYPDGLARRRDPGERADHDGRGQLRRDDEPPARTARGRPVDEAVREIVVVLRHAVQPARRRCAGAAVRARRAGVRAAGRDERRRTRRRRRLAAGRMAHAAYNTGSWRAGGGGGIRTLDPA